jgi:hypothetical protein
MNKLFAGAFVNSQASKPFDLSQRPLRQWHVIAMAAAIALRWATTVPAADPVVFESGERQALLVELFTSEGCSSCPPADAWLSRLKANPELWKTYVPVAFHVDYWNRLGWTDRFSSPDYTSRQRLYAANGSSDSVYTPEVVLNGREWRGFFSGQSLPSPAAEGVGRLKVTLRERGRAEVVFTSAGNAPKPTQVEFALLGTNLESDVKVGENGGRKLHHDFVVLQWSTAKLTAAGTQYTAILAWRATGLAEPSAIAAWVTAGNGQPPLQAVGGWLGAR